MAQLGRPGYGQQRQLLGGDRTPPPLAVEAVNDLSGLSGSSITALQKAYSITSSASASSVGGTARPSAFAVLRLITNSNLVGCITGKSAGLSPLRMRPT